MMPPILFVNTGAKSLV